MWKQANKVHKWLKIVVLQDAQGPQAVTSILKISSSALGALDSFTERTFLDLFGEKDIIKKGEMLFSVMHLLGSHFFHQIDEYYELLDKVNKRTEFKKIQGIQVALCYKDLQPSSILTHLLKKKMRTRWPGLSGGIMVYPNKRKKGTIALKRLNDDPRVDFTRVADYEKVVYAHPKGFFLSVEPMPQEKLELYIQGAILD